MGVFIADPEGRICYANESFSRILGRDEKADLTGANLFEWEWVKDIQLQNKFTRLIKNNEPFQNELLQFQNSKNQELRLSLKANPLEDENAGMHGLICFVQDISELVYLKKTLKQKSRELSIINEISLALSTTLATDQILEMILIGVTCGQGLGFNRAFLLLVDEKANRLVGKMALGTSDPEEAGKIWEELSKKKLTFKEALEGYRETTNQKDLQAKRIVENLKISMDDDDNILVYALKNGTPVNSEENSKCQSVGYLTELLGTEKFAVAPLVSKDKFRGIIIADNFITSKSIEDEDIRLLQTFANQASVVIENSELYHELTRQVEKLEEANNALAQNTERMMMIEKFSTIGQLTSTVAHQLRNPMTIIGGFARSLIKKVDLDDPRYNSSRIIAQQIERMEGILNRLLDFTPKPKMKPKEADINLIMEQGLKMVEKRLTQSGIVLIKDLNKDLPSLSIDAEQLQVALVNIFRNSIEAMSFGGELKVATRADGQDLKIEIKDKGPGIAENDLKHIFDPFYTTRENADGLGLTIASEIIKNHNGRIWAESQQGEGTRVYISLPMKRGEHQ
jgi:PAS domain S-box-containing protein